MIYDRDLDGIEDSLTVHSILLKNCLKKRVLSELSLLKLMKICSKDLHRQIYRSLHRKMLTDTKSCVMREMKKE